jgi:23S rRNA (cytidine1920-2'-O)/16S rRNA (cytidine1409-2'-O)-methyltransferase
LIGANYILKSRLDELLVIRKLASDIKEAQAIIGAGQVFVNEICSDKAGIFYNFDTDIRLKGKSRYVSRGGLKLEKAVHHFDINVKKFICADIGASTGGFTDCLLQHGAAKVYAVDVAYGQFSWKLRQDPRVVVLERFNARKLTVKEIPDVIDLAVIDASFISLKKLLPPLIPLFSNRLNILALIKPQFELPKEMIGKGGVVRQDSCHKEAVDSISIFAKEKELEVKGVVTSPILGPKGNKEFLIYLTK